MSTFSATPLTAIDLQSRTIELLRFPLTVFVVFIHAVGTPPLEAPNYADFGAMDFFNVIRIMGSNVLTHTAVPCFFLISGFLYFLNLKKWDVRSYRQKTMRRFYTLLIPYVLWNLLSLAVRLGGCLLGNWIPGMGDAAFLNQCTAVNWLWDFEQWGFHTVNWLGEAVIRSGPTNAPLWFLRDLICISLLSPLVYYYVRYTRHWGVLLLGLCYVSQVPHSLGAISITGVFFFTLGAYFSIHDINLIEWAHHWSKSLGLIALTILPFAVYYNGGNTRVGFILLPFFIITAIPLLFRWGADCAKRGWTMPSLLSSSSFFIYALHSVLVLRLCIKVSEAIIPWDAPWAHLLRYFLLPALIVGCCVLCYALLQKFCPRILRLVTGR
jgi:peptidoglycan/LPS O-acetylase OafA/YrhL